jgi:hypothetical protein
MKKINMLILLLIIIFGAYKALWVCMEIANTTDDPIQVIALERGERKLWEGYVKPYSSIKFHFIPKTNGIVVFKCTRNGRNYVVSSQYFTKRFGGKHYVDIGKIKPTS